MPQRGETGWADRPGGRLFLIVFTIALIVGIASSFFVDVESPGVRWVGIAVMASALVAVYLFAWKTGRSD